MGVKAAIQTRTSAAVVMVVVVAVIVLIVVSVIVVRVYLMRFSSPFIMQYQHPISCFGKPHQNPLSDKPSISKAVCGST